MKTFKITFFLLVAISAFAQKNTSLISDRALTPARGHYLQLQAFDPKPVSPNEAVDKLTYPFDSAVAKRRLSITTKMN